MNNDFRKVDVDMIKPFADVPTTDSSSNPKSIPIKSSLKPSKLNGDKNAVNLSDRKDCTIIQTTNSNNCNMGPKSGLKKLPLPHLLNIRNVDGKDGNILNPAEIEMQG
jgi:hypothetical protein